MAMLRLVFGKRNSFKDLLKVETQLVVERDDVVVQALLPNNALVERPI